MSLVFLTSRSRLSRKRNRGLRLVRIIGRGVV